jgi:uncharacterized membrane protein
LIIGIFSFIQQKILSKRTKVHHFLFQLFLVLTGVIILLPAAYNFIKARNPFVNAIIVGMYILLLFSFAYATRDEHVDRNEIRQAESMMMGNFNQNRMFRNTKRSRKRR